MEAFEKITVTRSLRHGDVRESRSYDTTAIAERERGPLKVLLAGNDQLKIHE